MNQQARILRTGRKFDQVLEGAREVFMADGFEGASVDDIARTAGVSKATLYSYFPDKRLLFTEVLRNECRRQECGADDLIPQDCSTREVLETTAARFLEVLLSGFSLRMFRICVAEADRFPELGQMFYQSGPMMVRERLTGYFREAVERGELKIGDFELAADQFAELCKADLLTRLVFNVSDSFSEAERRRIVDGAVETFLARYGA
jgi:AcrR family transcriptional regulator